MDMHVETNKKMILIGIVAIFISLVVGSCLYIEYRYQSAVSLLNKGQYSEAKKEFAQLESYSESQKYLIECKYQEIKQKFENGDYDSAMASIKYDEEMMDYKDVQEIYDKCLWQLDNIRYEKVLDNYRNMYSLSYSALEDVIDEADDLAKKNFNNESAKLSAISKEIRKYFDVSEQIYNDYSNIIAANLSYSTDSIMEFAQETLSKKYATSKANIQYTFDAYFKYVKQGGRYVDY